MPLPKYYEMHKPFLEYLSDGKEHKLKELKQYVSKQLHLTESQLAEMLPSGRQTVFDNRIGWARTYLKKAGLIESPSRAAFVITEEGAKVLEDNPEVIDVDYLMRYEILSAQLRAKAEKACLLLLQNFQSRPSSMRQNSILYSLVGEW